MPILPPEEVDIKFHERVVNKTILKKEGGVEPVVHAAIFLAENGYLFPLYSKLFNSCNFSNKISFNTT